MTENEAIELLRSMQNPKQDYADVVCAPAFCTGFRFVYPEPEDYAIEEAIKALKEIQLYKDNKLCLVPEDVYSRQCSELDTYKEIRTVEECREAVEKQKPKKPVKDKYHHNCCPNCGWIVSGEGGYGEEFCPHCENCGQAIRWVNENLEGMEDE